MTKPVELTVIDTTTAEWEPFPVDCIEANLEHVPLVSDPETGMMVLKMVYGVGFTNPWHSHPCAHGVSVLDGTLSTHQGQYAAGSFVWFPEGGIMEHGATQDEDCTFLFITDKAFDTHFVGDDSDPEAPRVRTVSGAPKADQPPRSTARARGRSGRVSAKAWGRPRCRHVQDLRLVVRRQVGHASPTRSARPSPPDGTQAPGHGSSACDTVVG